MPPLSLVFPNDIVCVFILVTKHFNRDQSPSIPSKNRARRTPPEMLCTEIALGASSTSCHTIQVEAPGAREVAQGLPLQVTWVGFPAPVTLVPSLLHGY